MQWSKSCGQLVVTIRTQTRKSYRRARLGIPTKPHLTDIRNLHKILTQCTRTWSGLVTWAELCFAFKSSGTIDFFWKFKVLKLKFFNPTLILQIGRFFRHNVILNFYFIWPKCEFQGRSFVVYRFNNRYLQRMVGAKHAVILSVSPDTGRGQENYTLSTRASAMRKQDQEASLLQWYIAKTCAKSVPVQQKSHRLHFRDSLAPLIMS